MSQESPTDIEHERKTVKVPFAIMPPTKRYQRQIYHIRIYSIPSSLQCVVPIQNQEILDRMKPFELEKLPPLLIPYCRPGKRRMPPVLRRGYPITTKALLNLVRETGREDVPAHGSPSHIKTLNIAHAILQKRFQWPVQWELVLGVPEYCIFEICSNYNLSKAIPADLEERMRKEVLAESPALWHLDYYKDN